MIKNMWTYFFGFLGALVLLLVVGAFLTYNEHSEREEFIGYVDTIEVSSEEKTSKLSKDSKASQKLTLESIRALTSMKSTECICKTDVKLPNERIVINLDSVYSLKLSDGEKIAVKTLTLFKEKGKLQILVNKNVVFTSNNNSFKHAKNAFNDVIK